MLACAEARRECCLPAYPTIRRRGQEGQLWGPFDVCGSSLLSLRERRDRLEELDPHTERKTEFRGGNLPSDREGSPRRGTLQARRGQDREEAWWHRIAWLPSYDASGNGGDCASGASRTLRYRALNQVERQNKAKCETQPHALLRRLGTLLETVSLYCGGGAYAKSAESHLSRCLRQACRRHPLGRVCRSIIGVAVK